MAVGYSTAVLNYSPDCASLAVNLTISGSNLIVVGHAATWPVVNRPTTVVWNTTEGLTEIGQLDAYTSINGAVWLRKAPTTGTHSLDFTMGGGGTECAIAGLYVTDVDQTTTYRNYDQIQDSSSPYSVSASDLTSGDSRLAFLAWFKSASPAPTAADTSRWTSTNGFSDNTNTSGQSYELSSTSHTSTWTATGGSDWVVQAVSLIPAAGGVDDEIIEAIPRGIMRGTMRGTVC